MALSKKEEEPVPALWSSERIWAYIDPGQFILFAIKEFIATTLRIVFVERSPSKILSFSKIRDLAFSNFWQAASPPPVTSNKGEHLPPLEGSLGLLNPFLDDISGVVLELGPGTGHLTHYYPTQNVSAIYGAEPNEDLHSALRTNAKASSHGDRYHILPCGAEAKTLFPALKDAGLLESTDNIEGVFDTIISVRVLCGVPELEDTLTMLYGLLKPGGKFVIVEHVKNPWKNGGQGSIVGRLMQVIYEPLWEYFIRCHLNADTETLLMKIGEKNGGWQRTILQRKLEWTALPWVAGVLVKKSL